MFCFLFSLLTVLISQGVFGYTLYFFLRLNSTVNSSYSLCGLLPQHKLYHTVFAASGLYLVSFPPGSGSDGSGSGSILYLQGPSQGRVQAVSLSL